MVEPDLDRKADSGETAAQPRDQLVGHRPRDPGLVDDGVATEVIDQRTVQADRYLPEVLGPLNLADVARRPAGHHHELDSDLHCAAQRDAGPS